MDEDRTTLIINRKLLRVLNSYKYKYKFRTLSDAIQDLLNKIDYKIDEGEK